MCTAIAMRGDGMYFGRNMDLFYEFGQRILITPRAYPLPCSEGEKKSAHYAMIGMGTLEDGCDLPLYADAMNECGLCMAALDFPGNAVYFKPSSRSEYDIAPYELIPWVLGCCKSVNDAVILLKNTVIVDRDVNERVPSTPLHWMLADGERSVAVEPTADGVCVYDDPFDVLTNAPSFGFHAQNVRQYAALDARYRESGAPEWLAPFSYGFGAIGLPGDLSSASRFVRAEFMLRHCAGEYNGEYRRVLQCMDILSSVAMVKGSVITPDGRADATLYSACMSPLTGRYYFKLRSDHRLLYAELADAEVSGNKVKTVAFPPPCEPMRI